MLVLSRKRNQGVLLGTQIGVKVIGLGPQTVRLGFVAPPELNIVRTELVRDAARRGELALLRELFDLEDGGRNAECRMQNDE